MTVNVNVPNLEFADLKGFAIAGLGRRVYDEQIVEGVDPRGRPYYWLGAGGEMFEDIPGSDCLLLDQGWVTVSMLRPSLLDVDANQRMAAKLPSLFSDVFGNSR
jgi:5'-nucleotidase